MNGLKSNIKTPSITTEARIFDTELETVQEGISMAMRLDEMVKKAEIEKNNKPKETKEETPVVTPKDIIQERRREFIEDSGR